MSAHLPPEVHFNPLFLAQADPLFRWLQASVHWDERMKARKTASFGVSYNYSQISYPSTPMPAELDTVCRRIEDELGFRPNNCLLNLYSDGSSSMGFHSDSAEELQPGTGVAIVSLGSTRPMIFRRKDDRTVEFSFSLLSGSLLFMSKAIQNEWLHAIPKHESAGERISLTFRSIVK